MALRQPGGRGDGPVEDRLCAPPGLGDEIRRAVALEPLVALQVAEVVRVRLLLRLELEGAVIVLLLGLELLGKRDERPREPALVHGTEQ